MSLRQDISSNGQALNNLKGILNLSSEAAQELQLPAMEILTELALDLSINLDRGTKKFLITKQCEVFLDNGEGGESATIAGRTLVSLSENNSNLIVNTRKDITGRLTELLDAKNNIIRRTIAAEIMENLCAHSGVDKKYMKATLLPMVSVQVC
jgi:RNase P/RNase MRP subunit p29